MKVQEVDILSLFIGYAVSAFKKPPKNVAVKQVGDFNFYVLFITGVSGWFFDTTTSTSSSIATITTSTRLVNQEFQR